MLEAQAEGAKWTLVELDLNSGLGADLDDFTVQLQPGWLVDDEFLLFAR